MAACPAPARRFDIGELMRMIRQVQCLDPRFRPPPSAPSSPSAPPPDALSDDDDLATYGRDWTEGLRARALTRRLPRSRPTGGRRPSPAATPTGSR